MLAENLVTYSHTRFYGIMHSVPYAVSGLEVRRVDKVAEKCS